MSDNPFENEDPKDVQDFVRQKVVGYAEEVIRALPPKMREGVWESLADAFMEGHQMAVATRERIDRGEEEEHPVELPPQRISPAERRANFQELLREEEAAERWEDLQEFLRKEEEGPKRRKCSPRGTKNDTDRGR